MGGAGSRIYLDSRGDLLGGAKNSPVEGSLGWLGSAGACRLERLNEKSAKSLDNGTEVLYRPGSLAKIYFHDKLGSWSPVAAHSVATNIHYAE
jgi:hypothetical protein